MSPQSRYAFDCSGLNAMADSLPMSQINGASSSKFRLGTACLRPRNAFHPNLSRSNNTQPTAPCHRQWSSQTWRARLKSNSACNPAHRQGLPTHLHPGDGDRDSKATACGTHPQKVGRHPCAFQLWYPQWWAHIYVCILHGFFGGRQDDRPQPASASPAHIMDPGTGLLLQTPPTFTQWLVVVL